MKNKYKYILFIFISLSAFASEQVSAAPKICKKIIALLSNNSFETWKKRYEKAEAEGNTEKGAQALAHIFKLKIDSDTPNNTRVLLYYAAKFYDLHRPGTRNVGNIFQSLSRDLLASYLPFFWWHLLHTGNINDADFEPPSLLSANQIELKFEIKVSPFFLESFDALEKDVREKSQKTLKRQFQRRLALSVLIGSLGLHPMQWIRPTLHRNANQTQAQYMNSIAPESQPSSSNQKKIVFLSLGKNAESLFDESLKKRHSGDLTTHLNINSRRALQEALLNSPLKDADIVYIGMETIEPAMSSRFPAYKYLVFNSEFSGSESFEFNGAKLKDGASVFFIGNRISEIARYPSPEPTTEPNQVWIQLSNGLLKNGTAYASTDSLAKVSAFRAPNFQESFNIDITEPIFGAFSFIGGNSIVSLFNSLPVYMPAVEKQTIKLSFTNGDYDVSVQK